VGLGGSGKTRLALGIGHQLLEHFRDGVFFADLSGITDPEAIPRVVADAIGAVAPATVPVEAAVRDHLRPRHALLIVDNCEHVLDGVDVVATWLSAADRLRVLATSQAPLRLRAEHCVQLDTLALPNGARDPIALAQVPSVQLFVERARAVHAGFTLSHDNAAPVAEICSRLEGMPMAIELAAAHCGVLGPEELAERLRSDLDALAAAARDVPVRQRSMRAALEWSLGVLGPGERSLFAQWGVFSGRPTLARVLAVCGDVLSAVEALVEHSLVRRDRDGRLRMPQSVQAHARGLLAESGEDPVIRQRHASAMAAAAEDQYLRFMVDTAAVLAECAAEREDLLAALRWASANAPVLHARLAGSIVVPRVGVGGLKPFEPDVEAALDRTREPSLTRVRLLASRAVLAYGAGERARERTAFEEAVATAAEIGEAREQALTLAMFAKAVVTSDQPEIDPHELLATARRIATSSGDMDLLPLLEGLDGEAYLFDGKLDEATRIFANITEGGRARHFAAYQASGVEASLAFARGDMLTALDCMADSARTQQMGDLDAAWNAESVGVCLIALGRPAEGVTLVGAAQAASDRIGAPGRSRQARELLDQHLAAARAELGDSATEAHLERGYRMDHDVMLGLVLRAPTIAPRPAAS
jgi:non-specific serine/threonine protein kinase